MEKKPQLAAGPHVVTVTYWTKGASNNGPKTPYYVVRFDNENGYLIDRFFINDYGRLRLQAMFKEFGVEPRVYDNPSIEATLWTFVGKTVALTIITKGSGFKESLGWKRAPQFQ